MNCVLVVGRGGQSLSGAGSRSHRNRILSHLVNGKIHWRHVSPTCDILSRDLFYILRITSHSFQQQVNFPNLCYETEQTGHSKGFLKENLEKHCDEHTVRLEL